MRKRCFKCGRRRELSMFYAHPGMADGHLNKCKTCTKADVAARSIAKAPQIAAYERKRWLDPVRRAYAYRQTVAHRARHPERNRARAQVAHAVRTGRLTRQPCEICRAPKAEAHHEDYSRPLEVRWLCPKHHRATHRGAM